LLNFPDDFSLQLKKRRLHRDAAYNQNQLHMNKYLSFALTLTMLLPHFILECFHYFHDKATFAFCYSGMLYGCQALTADEKAKHAGEDFNTDNTWN
jgi:hypothetical protein